MYRILTIEREFGCGAGDIAEVLARRLGWKLWDRALTQEIAKTAAVDPSAVAICDERCDSTFHRLAKVFWGGGYEGSMPFRGRRPLVAVRLLAAGGQVRGGMG